jgi:hypothetical protein
MGCVASQWAVEPHPPGGPAAGRQREIEGGLKCAGRGGTVNARSVGPGECRPAQAPGSAVIAPGALIARQLGEEVEPRPATTVDNEVDAGAIDGELRAAGPGRLSVARQERQSPGPDERRGTALIVDEVDVKPGEAARVVQ